MAQVFQDAAPALAGQLTDRENEFLTLLGEAAGAVLNGRIAFGEFIGWLWLDLSTLRTHDFDVDALARTGFRFPDGFQLANFRGRAENASRLPSQAERAFLEDLVGLVHFTLRNRLSFFRVLASVAHDVGEINKYGSIEKALAEFVVPKVSGWAKRNAAPVGEPEPE